MPSFHTQKRVRHSPEKMFALVADIERYPEFVPMCTGLAVRSRREKDGNMLLVADMSVGYKMVRETFATQVYVQPEACRIDVQYIDGPFRHLENRWQFLPIDGAPALAGPAGEKERPLSGASAAAGREAADSAILAALPAAENPGKNEIEAAPSSGEACLVDFYIDYAFKNPMLAALMGAMFDIAFRRFTQAFETRADKIYGVGV